MYTKSKNGLQKHFDFIVLDIISLQVAFFGAHLLRFGWGNPYEEILNLNMALVMILVDVASVLILDSFKNVLKRGYYLELAATVKHVLAVFGMTAGYMFVIKAGQAYSRIFIVLAMGLYLVLTYVTRLLWKHYITKVRKINGKRSVLVVTTEVAAEDVVRNFRKNNYDDYFITGIAILDKDVKGTKIADIPVVADGSDVLDYTCRGWIDEVFIHAKDPTINTTELANKFVEMGVVVHLGITLREWVGGNKVMVKKIGGYYTLTSTITYATPLQSFLKRGMDVAAGIVGCIVTALLFVVLAPLIYIQSPGPIFFSQTRVGKNGRKFKIYKFRSMYVDAEERKKELMAQNRVKDGMMFKLDYDPRIIGSKMLPDGTVKKGLGNFIRDFSLDEFPQFWNVLKGDMSLIGTRPPTEDEWEKYELHHRARLAIKPGITGMWQVSGRSDITDFEEVVKLDTQYIMNWSMGMDMRILLKTVLVVLGRKGSM